MTWEEINRRCDYDFNKLILLMPEDVRKEIDELWNGGELNPYKAAEAVLTKRAVAERPVDLDEVYRKFEEEFGAKAKKSEKVPKPKRKSFGKFIEELGEKTANKAEVLAAMDCLMHHLKVEDHLKQWTAEFPDEQDWNLLDWTPDDAACRTEQYMKAASGMSDRDFEGLVMMFATIVSVQCFSKVFNEGVFSFVSGGSNERSR